MKENNLDAFVVFNQEDNNKNMRYLSGFGGTSGVLVIGKNKQALLVDTRYTERARKEAKGFTVIEMPRGSGVLDDIKKGLEVVNVQNNQRVGYEGRKISFLMAKEWQKNLSQRLVPTEHIVERLRQYKDEDEISCIRQACRATSDVFCEVEKLIVSGMKESEVATLIDISLRKHGASQNSFMTIVASGPNAAIPHHEAGERRIRAGETLILDFGGVFKDGYVSDITRTIFVPGKKPDEEFVRIYKAVRGAQKVAEEVLRAGQTFRDYNRVAREYLEERGYGKYFTHSIGHSLGLEAHDPFNYKTDKIEVGTVLTNEPGVYIPGKGGVRIEDDFVVTKQGPKKLTNAPYLVF